MWEGAGDKNTGIFTTDGPCNVVYSRTRDATEYGDMGILSIMVMPHNGDFPVETFMASDQSTSASSVIYESGTFYLKIRSANCNWTVVAIE